MDINYKILSACCREDKVRFLPSINFCKDSAESITYSGAASTAGVGEINTNIKLTNFTANSEWGSNGWNFSSGRVQRQLNTSFDPAGGTIGSSNNNFITAANCKTVGKNYCVQTGNIRYYLLYNCNHSIKNSTLYF